MEVPTEDNNNNNIAAVLVSRCYHTNIQLFQLEIDFDNKLSLLILFTVKCEYINMNFKFQLCNFI